MKRRFRVLFICMVSICMVLFSDARLLHNISSVTVEAHSGRTDSSGGHKDNKNKSGLGYYHYHCGGNPPHLHNNGTCPYSSSKSISSATKSKTDTKTSSSKTSKITTSTIKKVQKALNNLGYDCGEADGAVGSKTTKALKAYQKDKGLTVDGKIGTEVLKALKIN